jgi:hypothetical protein
VKLFFDALSFIISTPQEDSPRNLPLLSEHKEHSSYNASIAGELIAAM